MPGNGMLFVLVGPSGAGKNTLMQRVQDRLGDLPQLATMTTRAIREGEVHGREHWFVSREKFQDLIETNALIEWQRVHLDDLYGTPRSTVEDAIQAGTDLIADIEFLGASAIYRDYPENAILVFITPSNLDILADRILQRGNVTAKALADRLERARFEMTFAPRCHYLILNDEVEPAAEQLYKIVLNERARRETGTPTPPEKRHTFHSTVTALIEDNGNVLVDAASSDNLPPRFVLPDNDRLPHEVLRDRLHDTLGQDIVIQAISDSRFEFVAPNYVTLTSPPPAVSLEFAYRCRLVDGPDAISGWVWRPFSVLGLPQSPGKQPTH